MFLEKTQIIEAQKKSEALGKDSNRFRILNPEVAMFPEDSDYLRFKNKFKKNTKKIDIFHLPFKLRFISFYRKIRI